MKLQTGHAAPMFVLPDASMRPVDTHLCLSQGGLVLFFYPRDGSPPCCREAAEFSDHLSGFKSCGFEVFGISRDDCLTHEEFADHHGLEVPLLADVDGVACRLYDVIHRKECDGVARDCLVRSTFIIDRQGIIRYAEYGVSPRGHAMAVLALVRQLPVH